MKITITINGVERMFDLASRPVTIGRGNDCDFAVTGPAAETVSNRHVQLKLSGGRLSAEDLGSSNGTFVNGASSLQATLLTAGDQLRLGRKGPVVHFSGSFAANPGIPAKLAGGAARQPSRLDSARPFLTQVRIPDELPAGSPGEVLLGRLDVPVVEPVANESRRKSTTRQLLIGMGRRNRNMWLLATAAFTAFLVASIAAGVVYWQWLDQTSDVVRNAPNLGQQLYSRCAMSTAFIINRQSTDSDRYSQGTGFLIDAERGYVVTNNHVIDNGPVVLVWLPVLDPKSDIERRLDYYRENEVPFFATVIASDPGKDLAILKVELQQGRIVPPLILAEEPTVQGAKVFTFGHCGTIEELGWTYSEGSVGNVIEDMEYAFAGGQAGKFDAIVTDNPTQGGDSGGPVVDIHGKVVGVVSCGEPQHIVPDDSGSLQIEGPANQNYFISVTDLREFLKEQANWEPE